MNNIKVFVVNIELLKLQTSLETLMKFSSEDRRTRAVRYLRKDDQWRCLTGGLLIEYMLRTELGDFSGYDIQSDSMGRPFLNSDKSLDFNISHSNHWVAGIISDHKSGIDVEHIDRSLEDIAHRFYTEQEREYCKNNIQNYYKIWTLKESFLKAKGTGMSTPLDSFSVIKDGEVILTEDGILNREYAFHSRKFDENYYISICVKADSLGEIVLSELDFHCLKKGLKGAVLKT